MRKAQIKMAENIGILVIFFFLLVIGLVFYSSIQKRSLSYEVEKIVGKSAVQVAHTAASLPELQCSQPLESEVGRMGCIDKYKLVAFSTLNDSLGNDDFMLFYYDFLKNSRISLRELYPELGEYIVIYDNPLENASSIIPAHIPVFLFDELQNRPLGAYSLGDLKVEVYS